MKQASESFLLQVNNSSSSGSDCVMMINIALSIGIDCG